jgi:WD40 repeat protein
MEQPTVRQDTVRDGPRPAVPGADQATIAGAADRDGPGSPPLAATRVDRAGEDEPATLLDAGAEDAAGPAAAGDVTEAGVAARTVVAEAEPGAPPVVAEAGAAPEAGEAVAARRDPEGGLGTRAAHPHDVPTIANAPATTAAPRPIPVIPGYEILGELGRGGMAVVYKARQIRLDRPCAVKMILAGAYATPEDAARFLAEAAAIARLQHPHIVQIHHIGEADGLPFFELEYLPGGLDRQLDGTPWQPLRAAHLIEQLARGIAEAHRLGIVHRDLKPSNVLLAADGAPKIVDFGLAKAPGGEADLTRSGSVMGSPPYMAPEQARGATKRVGPAADVYALGSILYELLTGRPPFRGASMMETLEQVKTVEPVPPARLVPHLPRDIETICLKCLQKEPGRRYADADTLAEDLRRYRAGEPIQARRIGGTERAWRWCRRNPVVAGLTGGIALALILGTAVATHFAIRATRGEALALRRAEEALAQAQRADAESRRARAAQSLSEARLYVARMNLVHQAWHDGATGLVQQDLRASEPKGPEEPDRRGFEWYYLRRLCQSVLSVQGGQTAAFSPDGRILACGDGAGNLKLWDLAAGREVRTLHGHTDGVGHLAYSPDGRTLASAGDDGTVRLWDAALDREARALRGHEGAVLRVAYSRDGRTLASAGSDRTVRLWDAATGRLIRTLGGHAAEVFGLAFSPDGRTLASASDDGAVRLWDEVRDRPPRILPGHAAPVRWLAFSPDGRTLASAGFDGTVKLWEVASGRLSLTLRGHTDQVDGVAFSPDGRTLASGGWDHTVRIWDATTGQEVLTLRAHTAFVWGVVFSPDGRRIAAPGADQAIKVWDVTADQEAMTLRGHTGSVHRVAISPDGRALASAGSDRTVRIWDAVTGRELRVLHGHADGTSGAAFSPDGRTLASAGGDRTIRIWDVATGQVRLILRGHTAEVLGVAYSPGGRTLASASNDRTVRIWDAATGREVRALRGHKDGVWGVAYSPDGRTLASASRDGTVRIWETATGREVHTLRGHELEVFDVAFSPDGRTLASAGYDRTIRIWDAVSGVEVQALRGHASWVCRVAFSPDGHRLASASRDRTVRIWDVATGQGVLTLRGDAGWLDGVAFGPDGRTLAAAGFDGTVKLWDASPMTPERRCVREARGVVEFLFAQGWPTAEVLDRIRCDPSLGEPLRRRALDLAESQGCSLVDREAGRLIESLYARASLGPEVLEALRNDPALGESVRRRALTLAARIPENPWSLNTASWGAASRPDAEPSAYRRALRQAEVACALIPHQGFFLTTLGIAQYRVGDDTAAVASLSEADRLKAAAPAAPFPQDLAFLALSHHRLGQVELAGAALGRLRRAMSQPQWARNPEAIAFLREAEAIALDRVFPADPFAP